MNCIDGIEGVLRCILSEFQERYVAGTLDDSDFIPNLRVVIDGAARFLEQNEELGIAPAILKKVMHQACKEWWLEFVKNQQDAAAAEDKDTPSGDSLEYLEHYFDHIFYHGVYPD
ncbi:hypothetical protein [Desulfatibacillum aliphaticivorans]|uniref:Uncharacterized protein n=1 Tax=Desulfatibacillum aliphaticivorans TaxID=218208 RepID=B8FKL4_DESAL|nr:hypothetical protein [Desulfatibacillum aliphaticivorans]ACL01829.1 hypothetical protein Dalk_0119 [Desulfatibacillum aliphaticivorans]